jgi:ubiquinone/menaquinone biosynthesis C-methylase UbiE
LVGNPLTAIDMNPFYLKEAEALAAEEGLAGAIRFLPGSAEALPFPDGAFDAIFSVTVLEECDADRALAEMARVGRGDTLSPRFLRMQAEKCLRSALATTDLDSAADLKKMARDLES